MNPFDKELKNYEAFPKDQWRWKDFSIEEIACRDGSIMVNPRAMDKLQALRDALGTPFIINSAYRSSKYNKRIGGAKKSKHKEGIAFDVSMANHDPIAFEARAKEFGFNGIGHYAKQNFMHIDTRDTPARWQKGGWFKPRKHRFDAPEPVLQKNPVPEVVTVVVAASGAGAAAMEPDKIAANPVPFIVVGVVAIVVIVAVRFRDRIRTLFVEEDI